MPVGSTRSHKITSSRALGALKTRSENTPRSPGVARHPGGSSPPPEKRRCKAHSSQTSHGRISTTPAGSYTASADAHRQKPRPNTALNNRSGSTPTTRTEVCINPGSFGQPAWVLPGTAPRHPRRHWDTRAAGVRVSVSGCSPAGPQASGGRRRGPGRSRTRRSSATASSPADTGDSWWSSLTCDNRGRTPESHCSATPISHNCSHNARRASCSLDFTVPSAMSKSAAIWAVVQPS